MDIELDMLEHYTAIAKQRKNSLLPVGRLPGELLAMIFALAQSPSVAYPNGWMPNRRSVVHVKPGAKENGAKTVEAVRYTLGWLYCTHVCSAWRTVRAYYHART